ncbi:MAG: N-6 DNA methylase [Dehalococcoidales bacterium]|nr:N-6 DNA methylase [Dehalococcoidales bacterium]
MAAPEAILHLVERFDEHKEAYLAGRYNEAQARQEFINPFFKALGWDMDNKEGNAEAYKDVVHEDSIKVSGATKAPDYSFRIGGVRKFFVEAKKPGVNIKEDSPSAFQLRRYAWSAKLPLSILTDFRGLAVYDCRERPSRSDRASVARVNYFTYKDYLTRWDEIADVFSRLAIPKGSFDKYAQSTKKKHGTAEVDDAFLEEMEAWREQLARNIALRNPSLTQRQLNFAVQMTIDRIIFLRICEDRGIEPYGRLFNLTVSGLIYEQLKEVFRQADSRYNSGLFHFQDEKGRPEAPDTLTPKLVVDDKVLKEIVTSLYYPDSPYEFSVLPSDILGQVYERFLGKVIRLQKHGSGQRAVVEEKPEVRKAGGVYYTPTYVVEYIVDNTLGKWLEGKKPKDVENLKVLDPACGSGSFLLVAYQHLLDWYRDRYLDEGHSKHKKALEQAPNGEWRLSTAERKRILLNHIYGVDIDSQAVEVTKLSLLLKVLEGESGQTIDMQLSFVHERALPDLAENIKCGNSLIGSEFYDTFQTDFLEGMYDVNAFDWATEFAKAFDPDRRGFDVVIGNPPYGALASSTQVQYYRQRYDCASGNSDTYALFIEKCSALLANSGYLGMITPSGWVSAPSHKALRAEFLSRFTPQSFATMPYDVFGAYVDTVIVTAQRKEASSAPTTSGAVPVNLVVFPPRFKVASLADFETYSKQGDASKWQVDGRDELLVTLSGAEWTILQKVQAVGSTLGQVSDIQRGVTPFHPTAERPSVNPFRAFNGTARRYKLEPGTAVFIQYDETLAEYKPPRYFHGPRLLLRELISRQFRLQAVFTSQDFITNKSMQSILLADPNYSIFYLLGLLNSRLLSWYFLSVHSVGRRDDFPKIVLKQTREMPFRAIDSTSPSDRRTHDKVAMLVQQMLSLEGELAAAETSQEKTTMLRQINTVDRQIDALVYSLYGLTDEEVRIVEASGR